MKGNGGRNGTLGEVDEWRKCKKKMKKKEKKRRTRIRLSKEKMDTQRVETNSGGEGGERGRPPEARIFTFLQADSAQKERESPASSQHNTYIANHVHVENHILFLCFLNAYLRVPSLSMSYSFSSFLILIHLRYALKITLIANMLSSTTTHTVQAL